MYRTADGQEIFVIDGHVHLWDASPENRKNVHGKQFIDCFYGYHTSLSPKDQLWPRERFDRYTPEQTYHDLFVEGYDDMAIFQSTYLLDFYHRGFNTIEQNAALWKQYPGRFILNGAFDPRDGERALDYLRHMKETYDIQGLKLYTAEWKGESRGYKLTDPWAYRAFELCDQLGIRNIHVHKGPTIIPLDRDAFDVADIDPVATDFQGLNWIVEHVGLPRLDDFCWIGTQETNVYGGLAVAMPFIHTRPRYFGHVMAELLYWLGPDKLLFGSDYAIWTPKWIIDQFMAYAIPDDIAQETGQQLTVETKQKILGLNAARLYGVHVDAKRREFGAASAEAVLPGGAFAEAPGAAGGVSGGVTTAVPTPAGR